MKQALVCGNGPSLPEDLSGKDLHDYFVIRINDWLPIANVSNKCDAWALYPPDYFGLDLREKLTNSTWLLHFRRLPDFEEIFGQSPDVIMDRKDFLQACYIVNQTIPSTGFLAIQLALKLFETVFVAGFDFFTGDRDYYFRPGKQSQILKNGGRYHPESPHDFNAESLWFDWALQNKIIRKL